MGIGWTEIVLILVVALVFLGPSRFPAAARRLGSYYREIRDTLGTMEHEFEKAVDMDPAGDQTAEGTGQEASDRAVEQGHAADVRQPVQSDDKTGSSLTDEETPR